MTPAVAGQPEQRPELAALAASSADLIGAAQTAAAEEGEWQPHVVLGHLSQVDDEVWVPRIDQMVDARHRGITAPSFHWWESQPGTTEARFGSLTLADSAQELSRSRAALIARLATLSDDEWTAIAHHDTFGVVDVVGMVREILAHDHEHLVALGG